MTNRTFDLDAASVLVVGATGGLGAPLVRALAARGAHLTLAARDRGKLEALALPGARIIAADLREPGAPARMVDAAVNAFGRLDGVVCIAGVVAFGPVAELADSTIEGLFASNLLGPIRLARAALPHLAEAAKHPRAGRDADHAFLLNVSAVVAERPVAGMAAYVAAKAGLTAFDAALAREVRAARIRVVDVRPPHTETELSRHPIAGQTPALGTGLQPETVAARIVQAIVDGERDLPSDAFG